MALIWADWQSCSDGFAELLDPVRSQYKECFVVVRCRWGAETGAAVCTSGSTRTSHWFGAITRAIPRS